MNKLLSAKMIVSQNGTCIGISCAKCFSKGHKCVPRQDRVKDARKYIQEKDTENCEYQFGDTILVGSNDIKRVFIGQDLNGAVHCVAGDSQLQAQSGRSYEVFIWENHRPCIETPLQYLDLLDMVEVLLHHGYTPRQNGNWASKSRCIKDVLLLAGMAVDEVPVRLWLTREVEVAEE